MRYAATVVLTATLGITGAAQAPPPASTHLESLLAAMGGRDAWARVTGMRILATHHDANLPVPFENVIVNDFGQPQVRIEARGQGYVRLRALSGTAGWRSDGQSSTPLEPDRVRDEQRWWEANVYRTLARLARGDASLRVEWMAPDRLVISRDDGTRLNWFRLNARHEPVAFGTWDSDVGTIFGPLANGPAGIRYPKWGARPDGRWRYEVDRVTTFAGAVNVDVTQPTASR